MKTNPPHKGIWEPLVILKQSDGLRTSTGKIAKG